MNSHMKGYNRVGSGKVLSLGASVPVELGCITLPVHGYLHQPRSPANPIVGGLLWRLHHVAMIE